MRPSTTPILCAALLLSACGSTAAPSGQAPPAVTSTTTSGSEVLPAADGPVTGQGTVVEGPGGPPELCLGPVRESSPPQCEGVPLTGWDWDASGVQEQSGEGAATTRWGTYAVTGTFDGRTLTVTGSVPLALYDTVAPPSPRPVAPPEMTEQEWLAVESAAARLPGALAVERETRTGPVYVQVVYDDGTIQAAAAEAFGAGAVLVTSALR